MKKREIEKKLNDLFSRSTDAPYVAGGLKRLKKTVGNLLGEHLFQMSFRQGSSDGLGAGWEANVEYWSDDDRVGDTFTYYLD